VRHTGGRGALTSQRNQSSQKDSNHLDGTVGIAPFHLVFWGKKAGSELFQIADCRGLSRFEGGRTSNLDYVDYAGVESSKSPRIRKRVRGFVIQPGEKS